MKSQIIWWFLVGIIAIGVGFYIYNDIYFKPPQEIAQNKKIQLENEFNLEEGGQNGITITPVKNENTINIPIPDLNRPIIFDDNVSEGVRKTTTEKINKLTEELKKDNSFFSNWIELGLYRKSIGDYIGARDIWEFLSVTSPQNSVSFRNLGDLYSYYLVDKQKAEENFLKAIEINPNEIEYYLKTMEFYRDVMKDVVKARQIIEQGINSNPASEELKSSLNNLNLQ
jgi:tetratricopeptide (TPR) repeat protein